MVSLCDPATLFLGTYSKELKTHIHSNVVHNKEKLETTQCLSANGYKAEQMVECKCSGIVFSRRKKKVPTHCKVRKTPHDILLSERKQSHIE